MSARFQSTDNPGFDVNIDQDPVFTYGNVLVYKLVDSMFPNNINQKLNGELVATHRHVALDSEGNGYVYDFDAKKIAYSVGKSQLLVSR